MSKSLLQHFCDEHGIELSHESVRRLVHHVHVYAPEGQHFSGFGVDNLSLWDGDDGAPNWAACLNDLKSAMPLERDR